MKKYQTAFDDLKTENGALIRKNERLAADLKESRQESVLKKMGELQLRRDYEEAVATLERIPPEIMEIYAAPRSSARQLEPMPGR